MKRKVFQILNELKWLFRRDKAESHTIPVIFHNEKRILHLFAYCIIFYFPTTSVAQNLNSEEGFLFSDEEVARIDISIHPDSLAKILNGDITSNYEYPAEFKMTRGTIVKTVSKVGFRLRGNTSRNSRKKSFKISINSFIPGLSFEGVEKINLNGEHNDPSLSRAKICWDMFAEVGIPAPRSNHIEFYINGEYRGLYLNVEQIDENFADRWFQNNDGNLYKCLWPADLMYISSSPDLYKFTNGGRRAYELTRNEETDDYTDLVNFIDILNNTPISDMPAALESVFNVNSFLKTLVVDIMTGNWDNYSFNKNNFYLYHNEISEKFEFIPYDVDNTFGIDWFGEDWAVRDIYNWSNPRENRPLYENIMQIQLYRNRFSFYLERFLTYYTPEIIDPKLDELREKIAPFTVNDIYRTMDYGYNYEDFYNSFENASGNHVKYGIKPFIETRSLEAEAQIIRVNIAPIISQVEGNLPVQNGEIIITAQVEDEEFNSDVILYYNYGEGFNGIQMQMSGDEKYKAVLPTISISGNLSYYIEATDNLSQLTREPLTGEYVINILTSKPELNASFTAFSIYPNPFKNYLNVSYKEDYENITYRITDISGRTLTDGQTNLSELRINTEDEKFTTGIYFIQIAAMNSKNEIVNREFKRLVCYK